VLAAVIGVDGRPKDIKAISGNPFLVAAAMSAFREWRYQPSRMNGTPVESAVQVRFMFQQPKP
jgi:outer membrane biosynthesis protein TonB